MKLSVAWVAAFALAAPSPIMLPAPAFAQAQPAVVDFCKTVILPVDPTAVLGECVAFLTTMSRSEAGWVANYCDTMREAHPEIFVPNWDSHSDCVRSVRENGFIYP